MSLALGSLSFTQAVNLQKSGYEKIDVRNILEAHSEFNQDVFDKLLSRLDADHIFLSDVNNLIFSLQEDYPELIDVKKIGESW